MAQSSYSISGSGSSSGASSGGGGGGGAGPDAAAVCDRTTEVKEEIETQVGKTCDHITSADLASIGTGGTPLDLSGRSIASLQSGDFTGLSSVIRIELANNQLSSLPEDIFQPIRTHLERVQLANNQLTSLPENLFRRLIVLEYVDFDDNQLGPSLPVNLFAGQQTGIYSIKLRNNQLTSLPVGFFNGLMQFRWIYLSGNSFPSEEQTRLEGVLGNKLFGGW